MRNKRVPEREWTWNESPTHHDGVHTAGGELTWFTWYANPYAGGGGKSQSFSSFLEQGPNVPGVPGHVTLALRTFLLEELDPQGRQSRRRSAFRKSPTPAGEPVGSFHFVLGQEQEYEFTITFYRNCIRWYLEFDEQWSDPDREALQTIDEFLEKGPPSGFDLLEHDETLHDYARKVQAENPAQDS